MKLTKIIITGANGQLGRALYELLKDDKSTELFLTAHRVPEDNFMKLTALDITNKEQVLAYGNEVKPDVVINCAAFTKVDLCETEIDQAKQVNEIGAKNLALMAKQEDAKLVQVSTDYVFDGTKEHAYVETDETHPISVYGKTKLAGEEAVKANCDKTFIVRTAWLYGDGANFLKTMLRLSENHEEISVVNDQFGTPTTTIELAKMIAYLIKTERYGIYHGTCEGRTSWYNFAVKIFEVFHKKVRVKPVTTAEYGAAANRPKYSVLENQKLNTETDFRMKNWEDALDDYVAWYEGGQSE